MLASDILELAKKFNVDTTENSNIIVLLNDIRILLELQLKTQFENAGSSDDPREKALCSYVKARAEESKVQYKDMSNDEYFNFVYNQLDKEQTIAMHDYLSKIGETVKNSLENDSAAVKGTLVDGVNNIITDAEKALTEEIMGGTENISDRLTDMITSQLGEVDESSDN